MAGQSSLRLVTPGTRREQADRAGGLDWLQAADNSVIVCRAQRHHFPPLIPGRALNDHNVLPLRLGGFMVVTYCTHGCGVKLTRITNVHGHIDYGVTGKYDYTETKEYRAPKGSKLVMSDAREELNRRMAEQILAAGRREAARALAFSG